VRKVRGTQFIPFRGGASGPAGLLLAINPDSVACVISEWDRGRKQHVLKLLLNNRATITVYEEDAAHALEDLGLYEFVEDWTLNLEKDLG
jgi:hypothetical protein